MSNKFQNEDFKSEAELNSAGATKANLLNTTKIYSPKTTNVLENDLRKNNDAAIVAPAVTNDSTQGYEPGSRWIDTVAQKTYFCISNTAGNALWKESGSGGGVGGVDIIHVQTAEDATLVDFVQTGLEIVDSPIILHGKKSFRLIHQAASTRDFKDIVLVDRKFRGKNFTFELDVVSSAESANLTILFRDETPGSEADIVAAQSITTEAQSITATVTSGSPTLNGMDVTTFNKLRLGMLITGPGIPSGTRIDGLTPSTLSATMSQNATTTNSSTKKISSLTTKRKFTFNVKDGCTQFSYKISALQEANSPESYIDDIIVQLTEYAKTTASITVPKNNNFKDVPYAPSVLGTTNANASFLYSRIEDRMLIRGNITWVGTAASTAAPGFILPLSLNTSMVPGTFLNVMVVNDAGVDNYIGIARVETSNTIYIYAHSVLGSNTVLRGNLPFTPNAGDVLRVQFELPIQEWGVAETETKTIPLTSSVLVTEPDGYLQMNDFSVSPASTATKILTLGTPSFIKSDGSAFRYVKDSVNGDYIEALKEGVFDIRINFDSTVVSTSNAGLGISKNSTQLTIDYININSSDKLCMTYTQDLASVSWSGKLVVGDKLRFHGISGGHLASPGGVYNQFSVSFQGAAKILNPSSDQKVEIPTHELRFEGASSRGSTDTAIVKFDTLAKIKGDGFTVTNTAANGTVITIQKKGRLTISTSAYFNSAAYFSITRNQATLTTVPLASEVLANEFTSGTNDTFSIGWTGDVDKNDIIRVCSTGNPIASISNILTLSLQEQSVAVALQNVAPRWDDSDSILELRGGVGFGTSSTTVRRFSSIINNLGNAISYVDSPTGGGLLTINESGLYNIRYQDETNTTSPTSLGIKIGTSVDANGLAYQSSNVSGVIGINTGDVYLEKGMNFVVGSVNPSNINLTTPYARLYVSKVGKTQGTVDVTPFVNTRMHDNVIGEVLAYAGTSTPENFLLCDGRAVSRTTYSDLFNVIGVTHGSGDGSTTFNIPDYRGRFLRGVDGSAGNDPDKASRTAMNTGGNTGNNVGSVQGDQFGSHNHGGGNHSHTVSSANAGGSGTQEGPVNAGGTLNDSFSIQASGTIISTQGGNETRPKNAYVNYIIRFAKDQLGVATPTEQVSSDTMNFVFKSTAITDSDPVGTFNTYTKPANFSGRSSILESVAPAQTISSMNINGIVLYAVNYAAASLTANPSRYDIKIGKGLKNITVNSFSFSGKSTPTSYDIYSNQSGAFYGVKVLYSEVTGILTLDAAAVSSNATQQFIGIDVAGNSQSSTYFTFNASQTPSLVSVPNLQQRVAYLSDVKPSGTAGGSSVGGQQTRTLNTLMDNTGIVTSLASNQFTLPSGTYSITASVPAYNAQRHQAKLRNVTDTLDVIIGSSVYVGSSSNSQSDSCLSGEFTINSSKTFSILHYTQFAFASEGLGIATNTGNSEVYTQVKITKIK